MHNILKNQTQTQTYIAYTSNDQNVRDHQYFNSTQTLGTIKQQYQGLYSSAIVADQKYLNTDFHNINNHDS